MFQKSAAHSGVLPGAACYANGCPAPILFNVSSVASSNFSFSLAGVPGTSWTVFGKGDLITNWTAVGGLTLDATGSGTFSDLNGFTGHSNRLYQVADSNCCSQIAGIAIIPAHPGSNLITEPFIQTASDAGLPINTLAAIFSSPNSLPNGTKIQQWNGQAFNTYTFSNTNENQWFLNGVENEAGVLSPGQASWLINPSGSSVSIAFIGLAPNGDGQLANPVTAGTNYLASLLPAAGTISSNLQYAPNTGDVVKVWNAGSQAFLSFTNTNGTSAGWSPSQPSIAVGQGLILDAAQTNDWVQTTPACFWSTNFTIIVTAFPLWTDTGLTVDSNATITITASGSWTGGQGYVGPGGLNTNDIPSTLFLTNTVAPHDSLIAFVGPNPLDGPDGENEWNLNNGYFPQPPGQGYWEVGTNVEFVSTNRAGELWLGINDDSEGADTADNSGHVTAVVQIQSP